MIFRTSTCPPKGSSLLRGTKNIHLEQMAVLAKVVWRAALALKYNSSQSSCVSSLFLLRRSCSVCLSLALGCDSSVTCSEPSLEMSVYPGRLYEAVLSLLPAIIPTSWCNGPCSRRSRWPSCNSFESCVGCGSDVLDAKCASSNTLSILLLSKKRL